MTDSMPAVMSYVPKDYDYDQLPVPSPGPGEAPVRAEAVGICPSDPNCSHGATKFWGSHQLPLADFQRGPDLVSGGTHSITASVIPQ